MLTRLVRTQLIVFAIAAVIGLVVMAVAYLRIPAMFGVGRVTVTLQLPNAGGLYEFANVTYRGVEIGKVTKMDVTRQGAVATLSLDASPRVPADLVAEVRSVSAVGEQYVDLQPRGRSGPFLRDGSVIPASEAKVPQDVAPMLERVDALVASIPRDRLSHLLDETFTAFNGAGPDLQSLLDSTARISKDVNASSGMTSQLLEDSAPVLEGQAVSADDLRTWAAGLAGVTGQLVDDDPQINTLLSDASGAAREVTTLLEQVRPTLPLLLANLTSLGKVAVTYHPGLQQLLVLVPPLSAMYQSAAPGQNATGIPIGDFRISVSDPPACTVGFLPPSSWRSPAETDTIDTPDGLYCKLPQDSPIAVRGARNYPCMDAPGKYAPTVQECKSGTPFQPLATRQHALGPYPLDPNLIGQGIPPDGRVTRNENIFAPPEGTPLPPVAAPSGFTGPTGHPGPSMAVAHYDPRSGRYTAPQSGIATQTDLTDPPTDWRQLVLTAGS